jgi:alanyl-tRNA synthetase
MTRKVFYIEPEQLSLKSIILSIRKERGRVGLSFPESIFFPEGGGQPCDRGVIRGEKWSLAVEEVKEEEGIIWHWGMMRGAEPIPKEEVVMEVNGERRREMEEQHTAQHIFSAFLEREYHLPTTGFAILDTWTKIEVPWKEESLPPSIIKETEAKTRKCIEERIPLRIFFEDESRRVVEIPGLDVNPCGGLHVEDTGRVKCFSVLRYYRKNRDFWRIEFVAGSRLERYLQSLVTQFDRVLALLGTQDVVAGTEQIVRKAQTLEKDLKRIKEELLETEVELLTQRAWTAAQGKVVMECSRREIRELTFLARKLKERGISCILGNEDNQIVFSCSPDLGEKAFALLKEHGFRGTANPSFGQGKVEDLPRFLKAARNAFLLDPK